MKRIIDWVLSLVLLLVLHLHGLDLCRHLAGEQRQPHLFAAAGRSEGKPFTIYKLRTMKHVENDTSVRFAGDDQRVTVIGRFLRKARIDELPQLWNVLTGDMSLIGPRPEQLGLIDSIETQVPLFSLRHSLRPGITGWAQVARDMPMTFRPHGRSFPRSLVCQQQLLARGLVDRLSDAQGCQYRIGSR